MKKIACLLALLTLATLSSTQSKGIKQQAALLKFPGDILFDICQNKPDSNFCIGKMKYRRKQLAVQPNTYRRHISAASRR